MKMRREMGKKCPKFRPHWGIRQRLGGHICKIKIWNIYQRNIYGKTGNKIAWGIIYKTATNALMLHHNYLSTSNPLKQR